jgi:4-amino-4-deoxy-L-arabinose transferase-like glycosyltransferase
VAVAILGTFLVFNDVVKGFFWSAHTQMWNVLVPLISISVALAFLRRPARSWQFMAAAGALLGIGLLAYGTLIIAVAAAIAAIALADWMDRERPPLLITFSKVCLFTAAAAAPSLIWMRILTATTGSYYHPEFEDCREFVWMYDYWRGGDPQALQHQQLCGAVPRPGEIPGLFARHVWNVLWPVLGLVVIAPLAGVFSARFKESIKERRLILIAAAITFVICLGCFGLLGFYRNRLAFNVVVPVIVAASVILTSEIERMTRKAAVVTLLLLIVAAATCVMAALFRIGAYV